MKAGDLRRFNDKLVTFSIEENYEGCVFMVLNVCVAQPGPLLVDILVDGRLEKEWSYLWVNENSEVISDR